MALLFLGARWFIGTEAGAGFLGRYPGETPLPEWAQEGFPAWVGWQHFLNMFFLVLIIRTGISVRRETKPPAMVTPHWPRNARKISLTLWVHLALDLLWLINGLVFILLLFTTGHWVRIVPLTWEVLPNAVSTAVQYLALDWPTENGWVNYNSLQQLAYFTTVFIAAPISILSGVRMSNLWPTQAKALNRLYPVEVARALHFPTMLYFVVFIVSHVALVMATGALRNLNHMYASTDVVNWWGAGIFALSLLVVIGAWLALRPTIVASVAAVFGRVGR